MVVVAMLDKFAQIYKHSHTGNRYQSRDHTIMILLFFRHASMLAGSKAAAILAFLGRVRSIKFEGASPTNM
jgi:hypothetical protein